MKHLILIFGLIIYGMENSFCEDLLSKFYQNDYKAKHTRTELINYNKNYINYINLKSFKYNRTVAAVNFTFNFKQDMKDELEVVVQVYKFASNEYRTFPARFQANLCKGYNRNVGGVQTGLAKCGNLTECFIKANVTYRVCNFVSDAAHLPPFFPSGIFMVELQILFKNTPLLLINSYCEVYRPIPYPKK